MTLRAIIIAAGALLILFPAVTLSVPAENRMPKLALPFPKGLRSIGASSFSTFGNSLTSQNSSPDEKEVRNIWELVMDLLHLLGISDEQLLEMIEYILNGIDGILSMLPAQDAKVVELAFADIMMMIETGEINSERLQTDLKIIYVIMWPYVDENVKPILEMISDVIVWFWDHFHNPSPDDIADILSAFSFSDVKDFIDGYDPEIQEIQEQLQ